MMNARRDETTGMPCAHDDGRTELPEKRPDWTMPALGAGLTAALLALLVALGLASSCQRVAAAPDIEVYALEDVPKGSAVFLGGCTRKPPEGEPRHAWTLGVQGSWRQEAVAELRRLGVHGPIVLPETRSGLRPASREENARWERQAIRRSRVMLVWAPVGVGEFGQGLATRVELGLAVGERRSVAFGAPHEPAEAHGGTWYMRQLVQDDLHLATAFDLRSTCALAVQLLQRKDAP